MLCQASRNTRVGCGSVQGYAPRHRKGDTWNLSRIGAKGFGKAFWHTLRAIWHGRIHVQAR
jgi:hypothetical protein